MSNPTTTNGFFMTALLAVMHGCMATVRSVAAAVLGLVTPIVSTVLGALAVLLAGTAVLFRYGAPRLDFPFWEFMAFALGCAVARVLLNRLTRCVIES
jgi:uncharacterized membrane-anchored protein